jgi:hypothetical protein
VKTEQVLPSRGAAARETAKENLTKHESSRLKMKGGARKGKKTR